ncbi:hypothetical protein LMG28614_05643 [Paraburkholderia ultramafica]|uniref:Antitoxin VbhA domain-containing protein n=1 Tax=Paraburkholderia ultramafica TaxID=1544867 RepID=A0A6S7BJH1_9BURK|nr:hypothetical protein [Paraburkholderia ultramafica]CAB3802564.1 hypothetical protein LMG28614_05643 [Paraburkholderia ultramafica]
MPELHLLTDEELAATKRRREAGEASLACEGIYLSAEEKALFDRFEAERLPPDECRRQIIAYVRAKRAEG